MNNYLASFGPALADHLWQSTAFAAAAWLLTILLRRNSARIRYGLWLAASVKFLIPFSFLIAMGGLLPKPAQSVAPAVYTAMQVTEQPFADFSLAAANSSVQTLTLTQRFASDLPAILFALWLAGVATVLMIWFVRWRRASVCLLDAVPAVKGRELDILRNLEMRLSSRDRAAVRVFAKSRLQTLYRNSDSATSAAQATSRCASSAPDTADRPATGTRTAIAARKPAPLGAADDSPAGHGWVPEPKTPNPVGAAQAILARILTGAKRASRIGLRPPLRFKLSPQQTEPSLYGILRPVLVWPQQLSERLNDEQIEAIMTHELAHARRFDNATAAVHMLVEAIFWFHPLVWWMERRMIEERERACDEAVAALGGSPGAYAEGILETCRFCVALRLRHHRRRPQKSRSQHHEGARANADDMAEETAHRRCRLVRNSHASPFGSGTDKHFSGLGEGRWRQAVIRCGVREGEQNTIPTAWPSAQTQHGPFRRRWI